MSKASPTTNRQHIEDYATVEAHCAGVPVYAFGYTYVYGRSPDLMPNLTLQKGHTAPWRRIVPKKSWEIKRNKLGSTPAREPKTARNDDQPLLAIHLIDGDRQTTWCSRGQTQPTVEPVWIRLDLPVESRVQAVVLVPHAEGLGPEEMQGYQWGRKSLPVGQAFPRDLTIQVSRDGWHWETVYENHHYAPPTDMQPQTFTFDTRLAKQIWITARDLPPVLNFGHCFSLAEVEVLDEQGENLALVSRGTGVTVSSTHTGYGMDRFTQEMLWAIQYDVGYTWSRVGYDMGVFLWAYVEREKGVLQVDARADAAITEAVGNGINMILCLDKGNWLYAPQPKVLDRTRDLMETYYNRPPEPSVDPNYLQGYLNYVRYMVRHFRDRVRYYEIMNEWFDWVGTAQEYSALAKATIAVIREEYPDAKVIAASPAGLRRDFIEGYLKDGLGALIDVIAWHPFYQADPDDPAFRNYARDVREVQQMCAAYGFRGEYMATEWAWSAPYPPPFNARHRRPISELVKAKYAAQLSIKHAGLDMVSLWNETFQTQLTHWSISLLRNTFSADPLPPTQPEPIYYVQRTLCTVLDDVHPAEFPVVFSHRNTPIEMWTFTCGNGKRLAAFWIPGQASDDPPATETDVILPGIQAEQVVGIDLLNGREQELAVVLDGGDTILKGILVRDVPLLLRF